MSIIGDYKEGMNFVIAKDCYKRINIAKSHNAQENKNWICDGYTRFYDGYTLNADLFRLSVKRGNSKFFKVLSMDAIA